MIQMYRREPNDAKNLGKLERPFSYTPQQQKYSLSTALQNEVCCRRKEKYEQRPGFMGRDYHRKNY